MGRSANGQLSAQWRERLGRWRNSGLPIVEFCRREEISQASFFAWRKRLAGQRAVGARPRSRRRNHEAQPPRFVQLSPPAAWPTNGGVQITLPGGAVVALPPHASSVLVTGAIRAAMLPGGLEDRPC